MIDQGCLYIATGSQYVVEAAQSAASLRRHHPKVHITCVADEQGQVKDGVFDQVIRVNRIGDLRDKVRGMYDLSPYERTLFLDTDTIICGDLSPLLDILDYFDLAIGFTILREPIPKAPHRMRILTEYNSGVVAFRKNERVAKLMQRWVELSEERRAMFARNASETATVADRAFWGEYAFRLDPALSIALVESDVRYFTFPVEWNYRAHTPAVLQGLCRVVHYRSHLRHASRFNEYQGLRLWRPDLRRCTDFRFLEHPPWYRRAASWLKLRLGRYVKRRSS